MSEVDNIIAEGPWTFDNAVTQVFPDMLARSIPGLDLMRNLTARIAAEAIQHEAFQGSTAHVLDLGCSRGGMIDAIMDRFYFADVQFVGVDSSVDMIRHCRANYDSDNTAFVHADLRDVEITQNKYNVVLCVLTAQFVPIEYRQALIHKIYEGMAPGGRLLWVEKVLGVDSYGQAAYTHIYDGFKREQGYSDHQIQKKKEALAGVLVPVTAEQNASWLVSEGFKSVQQYFQALQFAGWMAVK
jgi:tRNA (cmo5U34)-methyltransferase